MSLQHALLGLLDRADMSGYDMMRVFDNSLHHYWTCDHTQIYRVLAKLCAKNLVHFRTEIQDGKPNRKIYHITDLGKAELKKWLGEPQPLPEIKHGQLLQLSFMGQHSPEHIVAYLKKYRLMVEKRLLEYREPAKIKNTQEISTNPLDQLLWRQVLENGIASYETEVRWIDDTIRLLTPRV